MTTLSTEQQIAALRPTVGFAAHMHKWFILAAALGVLIAIVLWHPVPLIISAFLAIVGFAEHRAGPNIVSAIAAYDFGTSNPGEVSIAITCGDMDNHYYATVHEQGHPDWKYEFIPQGWQPAKGRYPAQVWRSDDKTQPILAVIEEGVLIPRYDPKTMK